MKNMKRILCALISVVMLIGMLPVSAGAAPAAAPAVQICGQQVEYMENPMGIDVEKPRFSWRMEADERGQCQTAYQLLVASAPSLLTPESRTFGTAEKLNRMRRSALYLAAWQHRGHGITGKSLYGIRTEPVCSRMWSGGKPD